MEGMITKQNRNRTFLEAVVDIDNIYMEGTIVKQILPRTFLETLKVV